MSQMPKDGSGDAAAERTQRLLNDPPLKTMLTLGLPTIVVVMTQICVGIIETYWTSRLGTEALAGVTLVAPLTALMTTMSNGGIGGGVSSSIARALGAKDTARANQLLWHAVVIALGFGLAFTVGVITLGPVLYGALGGEGQVLNQALIYSAWVFGGSVPLWLMNLLSSAMRGSGDVKFPATISLIGAAITVPLSPALIFGWGPLPAMGIGGAGAAVLIFYLGAVVALMQRLRSGQAGLTLKVTPLSRDAFGAILGVGLISALGTILANLTTVFVTGAVGLAGGAVLAGYGVASRIDFLLIPLLFGFATAVVTVVGLATGAGNLARAREAAWKAGALAFAVTQCVGVVVALWPQAWMGLFSTDPQVIAAGSDYLRVAAPAYGAFGLGLMLYFASQGLGKVQWPLVAGVSRLAVAGGGSWVLASQLGGVIGPGAAVALGSLVFGAINAFGFWRVSRPR
jgi:putative MATE family efflux protein